MAQRALRPAIALIGVFAALMLLSTLFHDQAARVETPSEVPFDPTDFMDRFDPDQTEPPDFDPSQFDPSEFDPEDFDPEDFDPQDFDPKDWEAQNPPERPPDEVAKDWYQMPPGGGLPPGSGGGSDGGDGGGSHGPDVPPDDDQTEPPEGEPTTTEITSWPQDVQKGDTFPVEGTVTSATGGVPGAPVRIYISPHKDAAGHLAGQGSTDATGFFRITATFPSDLPPADYQLLAQHTGTTVDGTYYAPSWSDPLFSVRGEGVLVAEVPEVVMIQRTATVAARLTDQDGIPIPDQTVIVADSGLAGARFFSNSTSTDQDGRATFQFEAPLRTGELDLHFRFEGTDHLTAASADATVRVVEVAFDLFADPPLRAVRGQTLFLSGDLESRGPGTTVTRLEFRSEVTEPESVVVSRFGLNSFEIDIPGDAPLGATMLEARSDQYGLIGQWPLWVQAIPSMDLGGGGAYAQGSRPIAFISVVDEQGLALQNVLVTASGGGITQQARTDSLGRAPVPLPVDGDDTVSLDLHIAESTSLQSAREQYRLHPVELRLNQVGTVAPGDDQALEFSVDASGEEVDLSYAHARGLGRDWTGTADSERVRFTIDVPADTAPGGYFFQVVTDMPGHQTQVLVTVQEPLVSDIPVVPLVALVVLAALAGILWWRRRDLAAFWARFDRRPHAEIRLGLEGRQPGLSLALEPQQSGTLLVDARNPKGADRAVQAVVEVAGRPHRFSGTGPWRIQLPQLPQGDYSIRVRAKGSGIAATRRRATLHVADWNTQIGREFEGMWSDLDPDEPIARTPRQMEWWINDHNLAPPQKVADAVLAVEVANYSDRVATEADWLRFAALRARIAGEGP